MSDVMVIEERPISRVKTRPVSTQALPGLAARPDTAYAREVVEALPPEDSTIAQRLISLG